VLLRWSSSVVESSIGGDVLRFGDATGATFAVVSIILGISSLTLCDQISWNLIILLLLQVILIKAVHLCWHLALSEGWSLLWLSLLKESRVLSAIIKKLIVGYRCRWLLFFLLAILKLLETPFGTRLWWLVIAIELLLLLRRRRRSGVFRQRNETWTINT
jgi:hypothetical protein